MKVARGLRYYLVMRERQKWDLLILSVLVSYRSLPFRIKRREPSGKSAVTIGSRTIHHARSNLKNERIIEIYVPIDSLGPDTVIMRSGQSVYSNIVFARNNHV